MKRLLLGLFCLGLSGAVLAAGPNAVRKRAEGSMLVTGSIVVAADGKVRDYVIDQPDKLPPFLIGLVKQAAAGWQFEPVLVDGKPVNAKARMSLRFVAKRTDDDKFAVTLRGAHFGEDYVPGTVISYKDRSTLPHYPEEAAQAHVMGTVYLVVRVNRQGQVDAVDAEQVNLGTADSDAGMNHWRRMLTDASIKAVRQWTFNPPNSGPGVQADHWVARVPVNFSLSDRGNPSSDTYGKWDVYIPGPVQPIAWLDSKQVAPASADAIPDGELAQVGNELHLLTPLGGA